LTNWDGIASVYRFIGFSNYLTVFQDQFFWNSFLLTVKYVLYTVIFVNLIAFTLAYLLTSGIKGEEVLRAGFLFLILLVE